jgi:hypothetical protein
MNSQVSFCRTHNANQTCAQNRRYPSLVIKWTNGALAKLNHSEQFESPVIS